MAGVAGHFQWVQAFLKQAACGFMPQIMKVKILNLSPLTGAHKCALNCLRRYTWSFGAYSKTAHDLFGGLIDSLAVFFGALLNGTLDSFRLF